MVNQSGLCAAAAAPLLCCELPRVANLFRSSSCMAPAEHQIRCNADVLRCAVAPAQVHVLLQAAQQVADADGISCEVLDLRSLLPWDVEAVCGSASKTGRLLVSHEAPLTSGFAAELVAAVTQRCFLRLEAPPVRVSQLMMRGSCIGWMFQSAVVVMVLACLCLLFSCVQHA